VRTPLESVDGDYPLADPGLPVFARVEGETLQGNRLSREIGPVYAEGITPAPQPAPLEAETGVSANPAPESEAASPAPSEQESEPGSDWVMPAIAFGAINLVLIAIGLGIWWWRKRRPQAEALSLDEDIAAMDADLADDNETAGQGQTAPVQSTRGEAA